MKSYCLNSAKSYVGKTVNIHTVDGATIPNMHVKKITGHTAIFKSRKGKTLVLHLREIQFFETLSPQLLEAQWR